MGIYFVLATLKTLQVREKKLNKKSNDTMFLTALTAQLCRCFKDRQGFFFFFFHFLNFFATLQVPKVELCHLQAAIG